MKIYILEPDIAKIYKIWYFHFESDLFEKGVRFMTVDDEKKIQQLIEQGAKRLGVSVEEYHKIRHEESIQNAMKVLGLTREEVIAQNLADKPKFYIAAESRARRLSAETGQKITAHDVLNQDQRRVEELFHEKPDESPKG